MGYLEDGPNLVTVAMNGWDEGHPSWWRNLEVHPVAVVRLDGEGVRPVRAREATADELERLWRRWAEVDPNYDGFAHGRSTPTPIVVLEPAVPAS